MAEKKDRIDTTAMLKNLRDNLLESTDPNGPEIVHQLSLLDLSPFKNHRFKPYSEARMDDMVESVKKSGIISPIIVRPNPYSIGYEIIAGHNRVEASRRCKLSTVPAIVKEWDTDEATIFMADSNLLQRDKLLPSEKAFAYRDKLEAMKRKAGRPANNSGQVDLNLRGKQSRDLLAEQHNESSKQIQRLIRLTFLTDELLEYVDSEQMALGPAVHLSHLPHDQQNIVREIMERDQVFPSIQQSQRMRNLSAGGKLDWSAVNAIFSENQEKQKNVNLHGDRFSKFFPKNITPKEMEDNIYKILEHWYRNKNQERGR